MMGTRLFDTAYVPNWNEKLDELQAMALPEPWRYKRPEVARKNEKNHILERYVFSIFQNQMLDYYNAKSGEEADKYFCIRSGYACFHTGLMTNRYKAIYGFLERNRRPGSELDWFFKGFFEDTSPALRCVERLPEKPFSDYRKEQWGFYPDWEIRVNVNHILDDPENMERIPDSVRDFPNLYILLETAVELARRTVEFVPSMAVPQLYHGRVQYLLPLSLQNPSIIDLAMTLTPMEGYYIGSTCLTPEMAYGNARLLARPTAPWLAELVEL